MCKDTKKREQNKINVFIFYAECIVSYQKIRFGEHKCKRKRDFLSELQLKSKYFVTKSREFSFVQIEAFIDDTLKVKKSIIKQPKDEEFIRNV